MASSYHSMEGNQYGRGNKGKKYNLDPARQAEANRRRSEAMRGNRNARKNRESTGAGEPHSPAPSAEES